MNGTSFSPKTVMLLAAAGVALFALSVVLGGSEDEFVATGGRAGPGTHSRSAVGYAGLYDALGRLGWDVRRSVGAASERVARGGTLVIAEPDPEYFSGDGGTMSARAPRLLLVLPKWRGVRDGSHSAWLREATPHSTGRARAVLARFVDEGRVTRRPWPSSWPINDLGVEPSGGHFVQLASSPGLRPVVGGEDGMLVGETTLGDLKIWVLADPDVMANHGIGMGDNIEFMLSLLNGIATADGGGGGPVVFDEAIHGFARNRGGAAALLFRFPYWIVTLLLAAGAVLLVLAGGGRFGAPRKDAVGLDFGKAGLLANSARLLDCPERRAMPLRRYIDMCLRLAARQLHAPRELEGLALADWLDRVGRGRGVAASAAAILKRAGAAGFGAAADVRVLHECARAMHRWKGEILDGRGSNTRPGR